MDRRRLLISIKGDKFNPKDAIFSGTCTAKTVNLYYGAYSGADKVHYVDNKDGTYTYYVISPNKKKQWLDRFVWYNSSGVKSLKVASDAEISTLNNNRFNSAYYLETIDFGSHAIKTKSLRESFYNLPKLKWLDISNWDLSECTSMYAMVAGNIGADNTEANTTALLTVDMPNGLKSVATEAHKMFAWNRGLTTIRGLKQWTFTQCTNFSEMFCECRSLKDINRNFSYWVTDKATDIHSMFLQCFMLDLSSSDFTTWDVSSVTDFSACFARTKTTTFNLSGWDMRSAVNITGMFMQEASVNCPLTTINLSNSKLDVTKITSHEDLFKDYVNLQQINLTGCDNSTGMVEFIEEQLLVDIPGAVKAGNVHLLLDDSSNVYDEANNQGWVPENRLIGITVPNAAVVPMGYNYRKNNEGVYLASKIGEDYNITAEDVASIKTAVFATSVTFDARCVFPDEAQTAANTFFNKCFDDMLALRDVYMLGVDDAVVLAAKSSNFGGTDTSILTSIKVHTDKGVFVYKNNLWVLYDDGNDPIVFADPKVEAICVSNWGSDGKITKNQAKAVTSLKNVFRSQAIASFDELKYFTGVTSLVGNEFNDCTSLTSVYLDNITDTIGDKALRNVRLTGELTIKAKHIGRVFLSRVPGITRVNMPNITSFSKVSIDTGYSFNYCDSLTTVDFGKNLGKLVDPNFGISSPLLKTIIFRGNVSANNNFAPNGGSKTATYYVPDEYLSNWQAVFTELTFKPFSEAPEGLL